VGIFLFTTASRPALEPTEPPIQSILGTVSLEVKRPGREADNSLHLMRRSRMRGVTFPFPNTPSWCGARLKHKLRRVYIGIRYVILCNEKAQTKLSHPPPHSCRPSLHSASHSEHRHQVSLTGDYISIDAAVWDSLVSGFLSWIITGLYVTHITSKG
jgi:hypothetical protein